MVPTFLTSLALGVLTSTVATIMGLSAWVPGSQILQGNLFFDTTTNPTPGIYVNSVKVLSFTGSISSPSALTFDNSNSLAGCLQYGNDYFLCHQEAVFTNTGGCVAGGCGTRSYNVASVQIPYSGSGSIKKIEVQCDKANKSNTISVDQVAATTASGAGFLSKVVAGSGSLRAYGSGGGVLWRKDKPYIKVSASNTVGANSNCILKVDSAGFYNPN